jgi:hypothetical protein
MLVFNRYFYKSKKSKLYFGDRVTVIIDFIYQTGVSMKLLSDGLVRLTLPSNKSTHAA